MPRKFGSWLKAYRDLTSETESPEAFHVWAALAVLSAVTKRQIKIPFGHMNLFPNLYVVLVAPPGGGKSSAMDWGKWFLKRIPGVHIEANKLTPEGLIHSMSGGTFELKKSNLGGPGMLRKQCPTVIYSSELSSTLGPSALQNGLLGLLTDLFDCPDEWEYKTLSRGPEVIHNVYLSIFGGTTPTFISRTIPADAIGDGFASRILFIYREDKRKDIPLPVLTLHQLKLRDELLHDLVEISKLSGTMKFDPGAITFYENWYKKRADSAPMDLVQDERFQGYLSRRPVHVLKIATLLSLAFDDSLIIREAHCKLALAILASAEAYMPYAFRNVGSLNYESIVKVGLFIQRSGGAATWAQIVNSFLRQMPIMQLEAIVKTMLAGQIVDERLVNGEKVFTLRKKPTTAASVAAANQGLLEDGKEEQNGSGENGNGSKEPEAS